MTPADLLERASRAGITVSLVDGRMVADAPEGEQADALLAELRQHRLEVARWLRRPRDPSEAGCAQPQNMKRFLALVELDRRDRAARGMR